MDLVAGKVKNSGLLDYVTGWYFKAAEYIQGIKIIVGFVSTNSITQGEQVGLLWNTLFERYGVKIHFGHRTFSWESEAKGKAHVHVVIIGFATFSANNKRIYECHEGKPSVTKANNISPYLLEGPDLAIVNRQKPISDVPEIRFGNQPIDGGYFIMDNTEKEELLSKEPKAKKFIRLFLGSQEFINGEKRWCLWLHNIHPDEIRSMPEVMQRIKSVRDFRLSSKREATRELAKTPSEFAFVSHPKKSYLLIPSVTSERRHYIPMAFMPVSVIASNLCLIVKNAKHYHFGILTSAIHMAWVRQVCGRLKSDYRYSNKLVYNNFPWPESPTEKQRQAVEQAAQMVLDVREEYLKKGSTLADLYDPLSMPPKLVKAHDALDRAVDRCYRGQPFTSERQRVEFLFALYEKITIPLIAFSKKKK
jgi:hypothetical protein